MSTIEPREVELADGRTVTIRSAEVTDATDILDFMTARQTDRRYLRSEIDEFAYTEQQEAEFISNARENPGCVFIAAFGEGRAVSLLGFANGERRRDRHTGEFGMSVEPDWQGSGLGAAMLQTLLDWAEANPLIEKVSLSVFPENQKALRLYRKFAFIEEARLAKAFKLGENDYADKMLMYRWVGSN